MVALSLELADVGVRTSVRDVSSINRVLQFQRAAVTVNVVTPCTRSSATRLARYFSSSSVVFRALGGTTANGRDPVQSEQGLFFSNNFSS